MISPRGILLRAVSPAAALHLLLGLAPVLPWSVPARAAEPAPAAALPQGYELGDRIELEGGVMFHGASLEGGVPQGGEIHLELVFTTPGPLPVDVYSFVHFESLGSDCRIVDDRRPPLPVDGVIRHALVVRAPTDKRSCDGATLELFTGLYNRKTGVRTATLKPVFLDDRMHAGYLDLLPAGASPEPARLLLPSDVSGRSFWARVQPWYGWLAGIGLTTLLTWYLARRRSRAPMPLPEPELLAPMSRRERRIRSAGYVIALGVPLMLSILAGLDYIKDDAYISFRYTHNLVEGHGLVFNPGEKVEGITNFLWTLVMVPFEAMGWDLFIMSEILGFALWAGILVYLVRLSKLLTTSDGSNETVRSAAILWGGIWLATSSSMAKWSHSGMEQSLAMFLPIIAAWLLWRPRPEGEEDRKGALWSGIFMGLGCATRPEIHFIGICLGLPLVIDVVADIARGRRIRRAPLFWFAGLLLVTLPFHGFRLAYYGTIVPNTFYVKTGDSSLVWLTGLQKLHEMFGFNLTGILAVLTPFAFVSKQRLKEKLVALAVTLGFMAFLVKVGVDEMEWHRLYLPALPFLVLLAGIGLMNVCGGIAGWLPLPGRRAIGWGLGWVAVTVAASANFSFTYSAMGGFNGRGDLSGNYHPDLGKFITRHDRPRALVAFQDMGSTPYHAPDIDFLDFIGLVDQTVARARYSYGLHAFMATESSKRQPEFDAEMRGYFYRRNPEWTILTTYIPDAVMGDVANKFAADPSPRSLAPYWRQNGYQFGITDAKFDASYVHVRTWARSAGYYLSLFRRKDLWDQIPREVVLDAVPAGVGGGGFMGATFGEGLELIGAEIQPASKARYEAFLTTWWRVPGPMEPDTYIFFHVERPDTPEQKAHRVPFDTLPGDWMYPADRWKAGQIIEHRVLFQVPWDMPLGDYKVMAGVYRKKTGQRLKVTQGPNDGQDRVELGPLTITPLSPPWDELIPRTVPEVQRKYPERIIDSGRRPDPAQ